jgi:hypothetical protein
MFAKSKYLELSELGSRFNLSFSGHLAFGNKIMALDGLKRCLFILDTGSGSGRSCIIDLNNVAIITLKKSYGSIDHGELKKKGIEEFMKRIELEFEFLDKRETIVLPFYDCNTDEQTDRLKLMKNAENWHKMLSKMLVSASNKNNKNETAK